MDNSTYLALGDSYTIGEQLALPESFPYQFMQMLRRQNQSYCAPEIVAKTGWTSTELLAAMEQYQFLPNYDIVTLLIGVNNQYRNLDIVDFTPELQQLLRFATSRVARPDKVFVLSIPDWGLTPFAAGRDRAKISAEIDQYNAVCRQITEEQGARYIEITSAYRHDVQDPSFLAADKLHPSGNEYAKWARKLFESHQADVR